MDRADYTLIQVLPTDGTLRLDTSKDTKDTVELYEEVMTGNLTDSRVFRLISMNSGNLGFLIKLIPLPQLIRLNSTKAIFRNYFTEELVAELFTKNDKDIYYSILNWGDYNRYVMCVNNSLNHLYNFRDVVFKRRLAEFKEFVKKIDLEKFYLGVDLILYLAASYQKSIPVQNIVFTIYPKVRKLIIEQDGTIRHDKDAGVFYYRLDNGIILRFNDLVYSYVKHVLYSGVPATYDGDRIIVKPRLYQQLDKRRKFEYVSDLEDRVDLKSLDNRAKLLLIKKSYKVKRKTKFCYSCKQGYNLTFTLDGYVDMCIECGIKNYKRRNMEVDLSGMTAYVSGARHKIGLATVLMLLRGGARVIASTRFPNAAWLNYRAERDFEVWKDRLQIIRCDFTRFDEVSFLIEHLKKVGINILINNACQTVKPTDAYLQKAYKLETILSGDSTFADRMIEHVNLTTDVMKVDSVNSGSPIVEEPTWSDSDMAIIDGQIEVAEIKLNQFKDIEDMTMKDDSTWYKRMEEVTMDEIMQVSAVNQVVPTMLVNQLKPCMKSPKFIINVTAIEGQFAYKKDGLHPHTNMCKAGINMMVKTMGAELEEDFYIYAVDPGFVSGVDPFKDMYPLQAEDGAARILDPIYRWKNGNPIKSGVKLKDFKISPW